MSLTAASGPASVLTMQSVTLKSDWLRMSINPHLSAWCPHQMFPPVPCWPCHSLKLQGSLRTKAKLAWFNGFKNELFRTHSEAALTEPSLRDNNRSWDVYQSQMWCYCEVRSSQRELILQETNQHSERKWWFGNKLRLLVRRGRCGLHLLASSHCLGHLLLLSDVFTRPHPIT